MESGSEVNKEIKQEKKEVKEIETALKTMKTVSYAALAVGLIAIIIAVVALVSPHTTSVYLNKTTTTPAATTTAYTLTGIDDPLNATQLSVINNAPSSYFEKAGEMYLNGTITNEVIGTGSAVTNVSGVYANGKPDVVYLGSITCIYCGENRWAMALALSRFGNFSKLFYGYTSFGDGDIPTLYWTHAPYNTTTIDFGSYYTSNYINFVAIEGVAPITGGFVPPSFSMIQQDANATGNATTKNAVNYILKLNNFQGTPYTIWGKFNVNGADAVDFGNTPPQSGEALPIQMMTHEQILQQLSSPNDQFAWTEYAAADIYIAMTCATINNTAPVCSLPAIRQIEQQNKY